MPRKRLNRMALVLVVILALSGSSSFARIGSCQPNTNDIVISTINLTTEYTYVGQNIALHYQAYWLFGNESEPISNATALIEIRNSKNESVNIVNLNTANGSFSMFYSSEEADVLTFTSVALVLDDKIYKFGKQLQP